MGVNCRNKYKGCRPATNETEIGATLMFGDQTLIHSMDPALKIFIDENADDLADKCIEICKDNGIKTKAHLIELSRYESLLAKFPVAPALQMIQALDAESHAGTKCSGAIKALSSLSVDAVASVMLNYGIVSALMTSISAGMFGGVAADEWKLFEENIAPYWESCVAAATNTSARFDSLEQCVAYWTETQQWWLIQFNFCSIGANMCVVWVATYLYIALMFTDIKKENKEEQEIASRMMMPYIVLIQIMFLLGVGTCGYGVTTFAQIKVTHQPIARWLTHMSTATGLTIVLVLLPMLLTWDMMRRKIGKVRKEAAQDHLIGNRKQAI